MRQRFQFFSFLWGHNERRFGTTGAHAGFSFILQYDRRPIFISHISVTGH
jgi:hypothetical protein